MPRGRHGLVIARAPNEPFAVDPPLESYGVADPDDEVYRYDPIADDVVRLGIGVALSMLGRLPITLNVITTKTKNPPAIAIHFQLRDLAPMIR
jgi:hypothetical protein